MTEPAPIYANVSAPDISSLIARIETPEFIAAVGRKATSSTHRSDSGVRFDFGTFERCDSDTHVTGSSASEFSVNMVELLSCRVAAIKTNPVGLMRFSISGTIVNENHLRKTDGTIIINGDKGVFSSGYSSDIYPRGDIGPVLQSILVYFGL